VRREHGQHRFDPGHVSLLGNHIDGAELQVPLSLNFGSELELRRRSSNGLMKRRAGADEPWPAGGR
jgi:hypothetical protein